MGINRKSIAFSEAHSKAEQMCGNFSYGWSEDTVVAMLEVLAQYAVDEGMTRERFATCAAIALDKLADAR